MVSKDSTHRNIPKISPFSGKGVEDIPKKNIFYYFDYLFLFVSTFYLIYLFFIYNPPIGKYGDGSFERGIYKILFLFCTLTSLSICASLLIAINSIEKNFRLVPYLKKQWSKQVKDEESKRLEKEEERKRLEKRKAAEEKKRQGREKKWEKQQQKRLSALKRRIKKLLKEKAVKMPASDIDAFLKHQNVDEIKELCEKMYHDGEISRTSNYRYFILTEGQEKPKKTSVAKPEKVDVKAELKKYKEMLDEGLITQEQYDAKSNELLGL